MLYATGDFFKCILVVKIKTLYKPISFYGITVLGMAFFFFLDRVGATNR